MMKNRAKLSKSIKILLGSLLIIIAVPTSVLAQNFAAELNDPADVFTILSPLPNSKVNGNINVSFIAYDDDQSTISFTSNLWDPTCKQVNYGRLFSASSVPSMNTQSVNFSWNTKTTLSNSNIPDGNYCLQTCLALLNDTTPYSACSAREIEILNNNSKPVINSYPQKLSYFEGETFSYQINASDPDGDTLVYRLISDVNFLSIDSQTGLITSQPLSTGGKFGVGYPITIGVTDNKSGEVTQSFNLEIYQKQPEPQQPDNTQVPDNNTPDEQTPDNTGTPSENEQPTNDTIESFSFINPSDESNFSTKINLIQWELSSESTISKLDLEYRKVDSGNDWNSIGLPFDPTRNYYVWDVSNLKNGDYELRLNVEFESGTIVNQKSQAFTISANEEPNQEENPDNIQSVPLIINEKPENGAERSIDNNIAISADFIPSADAAILPETAEIRLGGRDFKSNCEVNESGILCTPQEKLEPGRYVVSVSVQDSSQQTAELEWFFSVTSTSVGGSSQNDSETETVAIFGRDVPRSAVIVGVIILCILSALLFIPWILYSLWIRGNRREVYSETTNYYDDLSTDDLPQIAAYDPDFTTVNNEETQAETIPNYSFDYNYSPATETTEEPVTQPEEQITEAPTYTTVENNTYNVQAPESNTEPASLGQPIDKQATVEPEQPQNTVPAEQPNQTISQNISSFAPPADESSPETPVEEDTSPTSNFDSGTIAPYMPTNEQTSIDAMPAEEQGKKEDNSSDGFVEPSQTS